MASGTQTRSCGPPTAYRHIRILSSPIDDRRLSHVRRTHRPSRSETAARRDRTPPVAPTAGRRRRGVVSRGVGHPVARSHARPSTHIPYPIVTSHTHRAGNRSAGRCRAARASRQCPPSWANRCRGRDSSQSYLCAMVIRASPKKKLGSLRCVGLPVLDFPNAVLAPWSLARWRFLCLSRA